MPTCTNVGDPVHVHCDTFKQYGMKTKNNLMLPSTEVTLLYVGMCKYTRVVIPDILLCSLFWLSSFFNIPWPCSLKILLSDYLWKYVQEYTKIHFIQSPFTGHLGIPFLFLPYELQ